jgi:membrane-anchored protein YejM (alkaline phosphatase superfamily)
VALVRGIYSIAGTVFIPSARYAYPAIIPTVWMLCIGWAEWSRMLERWMHIPKWAKIAVYLISFLFLDILSIWTIARFYGKL